jgi:type 1 glutamine amidotransferase
MSWKEVGLTKYTVYELRSPIPGIITFKSNSFTMKKIFKGILWTLGILIVVLFAAGSIFAYKVKNGFPVSYETEKPALDIPSGTHAILLFSKSTGFRHAGSIAAGKLAIKSIAEKNGWSLYETEAGGVFNPEQLAKFDVIVFNNSTGRVLNEDQQKALQERVEGGARWVGIHGSGDFSHPWPWYVNSLIGAEFSHHPLNPDGQDAEVVLDLKADSTTSMSLLSSWPNKDEWYVFFAPPKDAEIIYHIDGTKIDPSGNMLFVKDKNFGMGAQHPVAWTKAVGKGRSYYTSMGHSDSVWQRPGYLKLIEFMLR